MSDKNLLTYYDVKYFNSSKIFEAEEIKEANATPDQLIEAENIYNDITTKFEKGEKIDEGIFGAIVGGTVGALAGPAIMKSICKILGIDEKGHFGKLLTSRLVTTAVGISLGKG